jgi:uncharacterized membrane protein
MTYQSFLDVAVPWILSVLLHVVVFLGVLLSVPMQSVIPVFALVCMCCSMMYVADKFTEEDDD